MHGLWGPLPELTVVKLAVVLSMLETYPLVRLSRGLVVIAPVYALQRRLPV